MAGEAAAPTEAPATSREEEKVTRRGWRGNLLAFGHLAVLTTFALAQPLFDLLSDNPEFFAARGSTAGDIILFAVLLVLVPPAVLLLVEVLVGLASAKARAVLHLALMGLLAALVFVQALKGPIGSPDALLIGVALALGVGAAALYARAEPVGSFLSVLTPAPLVFLILFLFISPVSKITLADEASAQSIGGIARVPVVMVFFDEFPTTSLMDADNRIDAKRYPGFAALGKDATWFRGAHSIYDSTSKAVPAIMDGDYPEKGTLPTSSEHPNSIFALLGKSHRMNVSEEATSVCPRDLCKDARLDKPLVDRLGSMTGDLGLVYAHVVSPPGLERDLASVSETWGDFGGGGGGATGSASGSSAQGQPNTRANLNSNRNKRFEAWIDAIRPGARPALNFKHALLPHVPWQYLPSGKQYRRTASDAVPQISRQSYKDEGQMRQLQLRHLLQVGFADLELKRLLSHLKKTGQYDRSLIVVTADHGTSFDVGRFDRRKVDRQNIDEISPVPLFIKRPNQRRGKVDDRVVETTDVVPTIADILGIRLPEKVDGKSAFSAEVKARTEVKMLKRDLSGFVRLSKEDLERDRAAEVQEKLRNYGSGADPPERLYRVGNNSELVGRDVSELSASGESDARVDLVADGEYANVDLDTPFVPTWVVGTVSGGSNKDIAVAVNGRISAVGNSFRLATGGDELIAVMVPESAMRDERNDVEVFEVSGGSVLRSMGGT
ncbi:MAG: sulfatase-like hydrolase/transferase [Actinomycetota bacterium]